MSGNLSRLLRPRRIALVGASRDVGALTARPALYLRDWAPEAEVVVVHPRAAGHLHGHRVVRHVADAGQVDVALLLLPADSLPTAIEECVDAGVATAIAVASGFDGVDGEGQRSRLRAVLRQGGLRLIGPNCVGVVSPASGVPLTFSSVLLGDRPQTGSVGLVTQSGAVGNALMLALTRREVGIAHWISTGDELDVGAIEAATLLVEEPACKVVGLFLEGITDRDHLPALAEAIQRTRTRVVALRSASSEAGRRAALGHTGRVVGNDEAARAVLRETGIDLVNDLTELTDVLTILGTLPMAPTAMTSLAVAVVTVSGGTGVIAADAIEASSGLDLARLDADLKLAEILDSSVRLANPLDVGTLGRPEVFPTAVRDVMASQQVDAVIAIASSLAHDYDLLSVASYPDDVPLVLTHLSPEERFTRSQLRALAARSIPSVPSATAAIRALDIWNGLHGASADGPASAHQPAALLSFSASVDRFGLERYVPPFRRVSNVAEAAAFQATHGSIALKAEGVTIAHRADIGAVAVGLSDPDAVSRAWEQVAAVCREQGDFVLAQAMSRPGIEVMVSAMQDPEVGPVVVLRPGGVLTELFPDSTFLTGDPRHWDQGQLQTGALGALLDGWRGRPAGDVVALLELATRLQGAVEHGGFVECNPVMVHPPGGGATVVDVLGSLT